MSLEKHEKGIKKEKHTEKDKEKWKAFKTNEKNPKKKSNLMVVIVTSTWMM
jgi:hypothetical protein